jgi:hypothetical protein
MNTSQVQWLMSVFPATQEAKTEETTDQGHPWPKASQQIHGHSGMPVILSILEA